MKYVLTLLIFSALAWTSMSLTKEMKRYELFCIYKSVPHGDQLHGSYVVSGYNEKGMAFQLFSPNNTLVHKIEREKEGNFTVNTTDEGDYRGCFRNLEKDLAFVTYEIHAPTTDHKGKAVGAEELNEIANNVRELIRLARKVRTNLSFQEMRERVHTVNLASLASKIKWSTFFKVLVLVIIGAGQLYILTGFFKKKEKIRV